jgi:signal peptidase II
MVTYNRGVSWSLLSNNTAYGFIAVALLIVGVIGMLVAHTVRAYQQKQRIFGELLVLGGALSNLFDRFFYDGVVDFITLRYGDWVFPIFNIADIAIVFGVLIMLYDATLRR